MAHRVTFPGTNHPGVTVSDDRPLPFVLEPAGAPVLFGCRTGICGTCVSAVTPAGDLPPPDADERDTLDIFAPDHPDARLVCQLQLTCDAAIVPLGWS